MTDEEVDALLPVVDEFVEAVEESDVGFITACLAFKDRAPAVAVILAQRLIESEAEREKAVGVLRDAHHHLVTTRERAEKLRTELDDARRRVKELRGILTAAGRRVA